MSEPSSETMRPGHVLETTSFREYGPEDLQRCVEITASGWPELTRSIHLASVEWYLGSATWKDVACVSEKAVGVLFGKVNSDVTMSCRLRTVLIQVKVYLKLLFGLYGRLPNRLTYIRTGISDDRRIEANSPAFDGEITFFAVDAAYRGRGIGKALMSRFIDHAKKRGARRVFVYTTDPGSDWTFYETYGFRKDSSFRDGFMSFALKEEVAAIIYAFEIE